MSDNNTAIECEADVFAALLLIPQKLILEDLKNGIDLGSDDDMKKLCKKYGVTGYTMTLRLSLLNLKK